MDPYLTPNYLNRVICSYSNGRHVGPSREADEIIPGLFLGGCKVATDLEKLNDLRITHVINAAEGDDWNQIMTGSNFYGSSIEYMGIEGIDEEDFDIFPYFDKCSDLIRDVLGTADYPCAKGRVLVHCICGISRAPTLVMAYLMRDQGLDVVEALRTVRKKREISPNEGFLQQLIHYSVILGRKTNPLV